MNMPETNKFEPEPASPEAAPIPPNLATGDNVSLRAWNGHNERQLVFRVEEIQKADKLTPKQVEGYHAAISAEVIKDTTTEHYMRLHKERNNGSRPLLVLINGTSTLAEGGTFDYVIPKLQSQPQEFGYEITNLRVSKPESNGQKNRWQGLGGAIAQIAKGERGINDFILFHRHQAAKESLRQINQRNSRRNSRKETRPLSEEEMIERLFGGHRF